MTTALPATTTAPDLSGWLLGHRAMRAEYGRLTALLRDADLRDPRRVAAVEHRLGFMHDLLGHHHHVEDASIWPFLRTVEPATGALCDELEADHEVLHGLLDLSVESDRPLARRAPVLAELHAELCRHLDREEAEGKPAIFDLVPAAQWEEWELQVRRDTRPQAATLVPWILAHCDEQERARLFAGAPKLLDLLYRLSWRRRYERGTRLVYGALPA
jgi:hypothetical protein